MDCTGPPAKALLQFTPLAALRSRLGGRPGDGPFRALGKRCGLLGLGPPVSGGWPPPGSRRVSGRETLGSCRLSQFIHKQDEFAELSLGLVPLLPGGLQSLGRLLRFVFTEFPGVEARPALEAFPAPSNQVHGASG